MADTNLISNYLKGKQITCSTPATELVARTKEHEHTHAAHQQDSRSRAGASGEEDVPREQQERAHAARDRREADAVTEGEQAVLRDRRPGPQEEVPDMHIHALSNQALEAHGAEADRRGRDRWLQWLERLTAGVKVSRKRKA